MIILSDVRSPSLSSSYFSMRLADEYIVDIMIYDASVGTIYAEILKPFSGRNQYRNISVYMYIYNADK